MGRVTLGVCLAAAVVAAMGAGPARAQAPAATPPARERLVIVTNSFDDDASVFRMANAAAASGVKTIPTGKRPTEVCVAADGRRAYVSNAGDGTATVLDLESLAVAATISHPSMKVPDGCATSLDSRKLYLADQGANRVFVIATDTNKVVKEVDAGEEPRRILVARDGTVYVSSEKQGVSVLSAKDDSLVVTRKVGRGPRAMAFTPDQKTLLVASVDDDAISFVDAASGAVENTIGGVGSSPQRIAVTANGQSGVVVSRNTHSLHVIDLSAGHRRASRPFPLGRNPMGLELSDSPNFVYALVSGENLVAVVDVRSGETIRVLPTGRYPLGLAVRR
jgi:YVTN family beta-propeller protein